MHSSTGKILIIDDEAVIRNMLTAILEEDYLISCADNSFEGLEQARELSPDLILLDINMPIFDGYELCRLLREDPQTKQIPVIFLTALTSPEDESKGLEAGAADYISKPINPSIVIARVRNQVLVKQQRDYLEKLSTLDPLTGIANRRFFDQALDREWRRGQRDEKPLSLLIIDIDSFKTYNDNYGHVAGDECLQRVAELLSEVPHRGGDLLARVGGEEFAVILPDTPFEFLEFMAQKFSDAIRSAAMKHEHSPVDKFITISIGGSTWVPNKDSNAIEMYKKADEMLYQAKNNGRNQICLAGP